jgi:4-amino-4-deoxy-L-arabinose transferase-like glycosyltransferase
VHPEVQPLLERPERRTKLPLFALLIAVAAVMLFRLGDLPLDGKREIRTWKVTQAMVDTGDWLVPRMDGELRLVKPPLFYWSSAIASTVAGEVNRFAWRLPSVLATLAMVWLTWAWGRSVGGDRLGMCAACCLLMMHMLITQGRRGVAEMELALFSNLALFGFDRMFFRRRAGGLALFALWVALAILSKATTGLMLIGLPIALVLLIHKRVRGAFRLPVLMWVTLGVLAGFAWYFVILAVVPDAWGTLRMAATVPLGVKDQVVEVTATHYSPVWFYIGGLVSAALPALFLLPWAVGRAVKSRLWSDDPRRRYLALIVISLFVAFSIIPQKQKHYLLPLLPALAILLTDSMLALLRESPERGRRILKGFGITTLVVGVLLGAGLMWFYGVVVGSSTWVLVTGGVVILGLSLAALGAGFSGRPMRLLGLTTCGTLLFALVYYGSLDLWKREFDAGTVYQRADYDEERWSAALERHEFMREWFLPREAR